jgi:hypothetical protein
MEVYFGRIPLDMVGSNFENPRRDSVIGLKRMKEHNLPLMRKTIKEVVMGPHT